VSVSLDRWRLNVNGHRLPIVSGDIHYWRHPANLWPTLLERVRELGLRMICLYVPWSVHETSPGNFDFGDLEPNKNLGGFIDLAEEMGLGVLVRPGPHINAELAGFGYPARLFEDPAFLMRNASGGPVMMPIPPHTFPAISYASEAFWREVELWLDVVAPILRERIAPHGPVLALQTDNESAFFFRTAPFDVDYHPDARSKWLGFLKEKYGDADRVTDAYALDTHLADLAMPDDFRARKPEDLPYYLDWIEFKEALLAGGLARLRMMWEERGVRNLPFFHNFPPGSHQSPLSYTRVEQAVDFCGLDAYMHKTEYALLKRRLLFLTGQSRFPVCPEFGSGCYHAWPPVDLDDQIFTTKVAWMHGVKGINFYMVVERERWYGSPITRHGGMRKNYWNFYQQHLDMLHKIKPWQLERKVDICLLSVRDYERLENAAYALNPIPPLVMEGKYQLEDLCFEDPLGFSRPIQLLHAKMLRGWETALTNLGLAYVIGASDLPLERLSQYRTVVCPTFEFLHRETQQRLAAYIEAGGNLICGPEVPSSDERMREFSTLDHFTSRPTHRLDCEIDTLVCNAGAGRLILVAEVPMPIEKAEAVVKSIARHLHIEPAYPGTPPCETSLHLGPNAEKYLFIVNPTGEPQRPEVQVSTGECLVDLESGETFYGREFVPLAMNPYTVRILEVELC